MIFRVINKTVIGKYDSFSVSFSLNVIYITFVINSLVFEKEYMPVPTGYQFPEGEEALSFQWKKLDGEGQTNFEPYLGCEYSYYENQWYLFYNNKWCLLLTDREMRTKRWIDGEWKLDD